jgi:hypothetical protein
MAVDLSWSPSSPSTIVETAGGIVTEPDAAVGKPALTWRAGVVE